MNLDNKNTLPFFSLVVELEKVLGSEEDLMQLLALINREQFNTLRSNIVSTFQIGDAEPYKGYFGEEVEFGDVCDAVRSTTFSRYPQDTPTEKPISRDERFEWCNQILTAMDIAASSY